MNAYEFKVQGEKEIISGHSVLDALKFYVNFIGIDLDEVDEVEEIPRDSWDGIVITNTDKEEGEPDKYTLTEMMEGITVPTIISSTAY